MKLGNMSVPGDCDQISPILSMVGNKWTVLVVLVLSSEPKRYNTLKRDIESISQRMLTMTLRGLERDGIVWRKVSGARNLPQVEYGLTPLGQSLVAPLYTLCDWAAQNVGEIHRNQDLFDADKDQPIALAI